MVFWRNIGAGVLGMTLFSAILPASVAMAAELTSPDQAAKLTQPCLQLSDKAEVYTSALIADGWQLALGAEADKARAQIIENRRIVNLGGYDPSDAQVYDMLIGDTLPQGKEFGIGKSFDEAIWLRRDGAAAAVVVAKAGGAVWASCHFSGTALSEVTARLSQPDASPFTKIPAFNQAIDVLMIGETPVFMEWMDLPRPAGARTTPQGNLSLSVFIRLPDQAGA